VLGIHAAETILASDHVWPHPKAGHMEASDTIKFFAQPLQEGAVHIWGPVRIDLIRKINATVSPFHVYRWRKIPSDVI